jgi:Xaa-Pro aminopeptidase
LNIHERPWSGLTATEDNILKPGVVMTVEPGLYYPDKGMGVRIEDTYWVRPDGKMEILAEYPYNFVLEMKKWKKRGKTGYSSPGVTKIRPISLKADH